MFLGVAIADEGLDWDNVLDASLDPTWWVLMNSGKLQLSLPAPVELMCAGGVRVFQPVMACATPNNKERAELNRQLLGGKSSCM